MAEKFEDIAEDTLKKFSETYPHASWSPSIYNNYKNLFNIYLHVDLRSIEGRGISITAAKANAIMKHYAIVSPAKRSSINNKIGGSENMMKNNEPSNYFGNTSHLTEDTWPLDCSKNAKLTMSSTETLDDIDQHFENNRLRILRGFEKAYQLLCHWSSIKNQASDSNSSEIALNIGDYRFEGKGRMEDEAKLDAIKKFYSSPVNNFFEINNQNNETESLVTSGNTLSNKQENSSHCADTKPTDCCDNPAPMKKSEEPGISPFLLNRPDENNRASHTFMETYNLRNSIWSPIYLVGKQPTVKKNFKVILRIGCKKFKGQGFKKCNAQFNAVNKFKKNILNANKETKNTTFLENVKMIGKRPTVVASRSHSIKSSKLNRKDDS